MKKYSIILVLLLLNVLSAVGQVVKADSINRMLTRTTNDTARIELWTELAFYYQFYEPDSSLIVLRQAAEVARKLNLKTGEIRALMSIGEVYRILGDFPQAMKFSFRALQMSRDIHDTVSEANSLVFIGPVYVELNEYRQGINYFRKALQSGDVFSGYYPFRNQFAFVLASTGNAYEQLNLLDSALYFQRQALRLANTKLRSLVSLTTYYMGILQERLNNTDSALYYYRASLQNSAVMGELLGQGRTQLRLAALYHRLNQPDSSLYYAQQAFLNSGKASNKRRVLEGAALLALLYKEKKEADSALHYQDVAIALKDSLFGPDKFKQLQLLAINEEQRRQQLLARQARAKARYQRTALLSALGVFLLVSLLLWRNNRNKQKAYALLQRQKAKTDAALEELKATQAQLVQREKMASLGELTAGIAHEIQNPLNFVNNFSEVNKELIAEMKNELFSGNKEEVVAIADDIEQNLEKINHHGKRADAIVKGMLQHSRANTGEKQLTDINALTDEYSRLSYQAMRSKDKSFNATINTNYDGSIGKINVVPQDIGRVLLNLLNNAFYAVQQKKQQLNETYKPMVSISTKKLNDKIEISVKDNGNGIPQKLVDKIFQPFFTTKPTGEGTGLGLSLSYDIVKAHGGELKVETKEGEGAAFTITLPV